MNVIIAAILVAVGCMIVVFGLGALLDSDTLTGVAIPAGLGAGIGYVISVRMKRP